MRPIFQVKAKKASKFVTKYFKHPNVEQFHAAIAEFVDTQKPTHFAEVTLVNQESILLLEDEINAWLIRVNRFYLGRKWHTQAFKHRVTIAFVEMRMKNPDGHLRALMLVRPPFPADPLDFIARAPFHFLDQGDCSLYRVGEMKLAYIEELGRSPAKIARSFIDLVKL